MNLELLKTQLSKQDQVVSDKLVVRQIAEQVLKIMARCKGSSRAIAREELFRQLYGVSPRSGNLMDYMRWVYVRRAIHLLRRRTHCYVCSTSVEQGVVFYYVPVTFEDASSYKSVLDCHIKGLQSAKRRVDQSVREAWHSEKWTLD